MKVAINGFGRIGRTAFRIALEQGIQVVAVNDVHGVKDAEYLLKYDSVYGRYNKDVKISGNDLVVNGKKIKILQERDPLKLPWKKLGVDIVIESTGAFRDKKEASKHIKAGAKYVLISAPSDNCDITIVPGVNDKMLKKEDRVISVASCTTNSIAPMIKVLNDSFEIQRAFFTTVHGYTSSQNLVDGSHDKPRRGRAAAINLVPTTTGASEAVVRTIPELKGKLKGIAIRAPVPAGSISDIVAEVKKPVNILKVNSAFKKAANTSMKGILEYSEDELVSTDIIGNSHSTVFDSRLTDTNGNLVKVFGWYDNEYGYSGRLIDVIKMLKKWV